MKDKETYTAVEAITRLATVNIPESTFYRWVRERTITKQLPEGRQRGAEYPKKEIESIISQRTGNTQNTFPHNPKAMTDWINRGDLPYILALEYETYGPEFTVDISISRTWWESNSRMCRILFDNTDRHHVWGALTIIPMEETIITKILRNEMSDHDIRPEHILVPQKGHSYYGYVASAIVRPEHRSDFRMLITSMFDYWSSLYPDIKMVKLFAYAATPEGLGLIKHLYFSPRYDIGKNSWELDLREYNPSKVIQMFQEQLKYKDKHPSEIQNDTYKK